MELKGKKGRGGGVRFQGAEVWIITDKPSILAKAKQALLDADGNNHKVDKRRHKAAIIVAPQDLGIEP